MSTNRIQFRSLALIGLFATAVAAQTINFDTTRGASFSSPSGTADIGGVVSFSTFAETDLRLMPLGARLEIGANLTARARMFGANVEAASVRASWGAASRTSIGIDRSVIRTGIASFVVRLAGFEVLNLNEASLSRSLPPVNVFGPNGIEVPISIGPGVMTVSMNAGIRSSFGLAGSIDLTAFSLSITGFERAALVGTARVAVGIPGANVGVESTLSIFDTTTRLTLAANTRGPSGSITFSTTPVRILLGVFAEVWPLPRWTAELYDYSAAALTRSYQLL